MDMPVSRQPKQFVFPMTVAAVILVVIAAAGGALGLFAMRMVRRHVRGGESRVFSSSDAAPLPGPERTHRRGEFILTTATAQRMVGSNDSRNERWADVAGNYYSRRFVETFDYEVEHEGGPEVLVRIDPVSHTFSGRLEARGLKPNFVYQIKLRGLYDADREGFEHIGYAGRWRLPGRATNYTDADYRAYEPKSEVESYLLFDFFVSDRHGNAVRAFALDSSLHVLWNASRQGGDIPSDNVWPVVVDAGNAADYLRPKADVSVELVWAEPERVRYTRRNQRIRLPAHTYRAELVLTEESFHSVDNDGGWWATVFRCPVEFAIGRHE